MLYKQIPITEARHVLTSLPRRFTKVPGAIPVTRRGKPVLAVMPWDFYESITETLEILSDETLMADLRQGIKQVQQGKTITLEQARKQLHL